MNPVFFWWEVMDVYVLDEKLRRIDIIDDYLSLVWTDRWQDWGEFELEVISTEIYRTTLVIDAKLVITQSDRIMVIESVYDTVSTDGRKTLKVSGRSIEFLTDERIAKLNLNGLESNPVWPLSGTPGNIARDVFKRICFDGQLSASDKIPFLVSTQYEPPYNAIQEPTDVIKIDQEVDTVYNVIKSICEAYKLGFRLRFQTVATVDQPVKDRLVFEIYSGRDLSSAGFGQVIFSPALDNISDTKRYTSITDQKTVAYVMAKFGTRVVYHPGYNANTPGFKRRVMLVKSDSDLPAGTALQNMLEREGKEALAKTIGYVMLEGEVPKSSAYIYQRDYQLGDLVEMRHEDGTMAKMRVSEQIFTSDASGSKYYPTLTHDLTVEPGTWAGWDGQMVWEEATATWQTA